MDDKVAEHFDKLAAQIETLNPQQTVVALSICRDLLSIPDTLVPWTRDTLSLINEDKEAGAFVQDLFSLIEFRKTVDNRPELKKVVLAELVRGLLFHYRRRYCFTCDGRLATCFTEMTAEQAHTYYNQHVVGVVIDKLGQRVNIAKKSVAHLYKDNQGKHWIAPEYFQKSRAKRLPWIRHVLENSHAVYRAREKGRHGPSNFVYHGQTIIQKDDKKYPENFIVIADFDRSCKLWFRTAFSVQENGKFLKLLATLSPATERLAT